MNAGAGFLFGDDAGLVVEHLFPAHFDFCLRRHFMCEAKEHLVVAEFGGEQGLVKITEFFIPSCVGQDEEAFAGAGFDEGRDAEAVESFSALTSANQGAEGSGIKALMAALHATTAAHEDAGDLREVRGFIAGDTGHGFHPTRGPLVGPARHQFHGILGCLHLEESVIDEQGNRVRHCDGTPGKRRARTQGQGFDLLL